MEGLPYPNIHRCQPVNKEQTAAYLESMIGKTITGYSISKDGWLTFEVQSAAALEAKE